jgi:hypothetical protein
LDVGDRFAAEPRGWVLAALEGGGGLTSSDAVLAPSWCDSTAAFQAEFCDSDSTYTNWWCHSYTSAYYQDIRSAYNYRGGQCGLADYFGAGLTYEPLNGSCSVNGSGVEIWGSFIYEGGWFSYTWNGANRKWYMGRSAGIGDGHGRIGHKWKPC